MKSGLCARFQPRQAHANRSVKGPALEKPTEVNAFGFVQDLGGRYQLVATPHKLSLHLLCVAPNKW